jgi:hypothetical protein
MNIEDKSYFIITFIEEPATWVNPFKNFKLKTFKLLKIFRMFIDDRDNFYKNLYLNFANFKPTNFPLPRIGFDKFRDIYVPTEYLSLENPSNIKYFLMSLPPANNKDLERVILEIINPAIDQTLNALYCKMCDPDEEETIITGD